MCQLLVAASVVPSSPILVTLIKEVLSPPKRRFLQESHGTTSQKTPFFNLFCNWLYYAKIWVAWLPVNLTLNRSMRRDSINASGTGNMLEIQGTWASISLFLIETSSGALSSFLYLYVRSWKDYEINDRRGSAALTTRHPSIHKSWH
jgi:hypothetical protein